VEVPVTAGTLKNLRVWSSWAGDPAYVEVNVVINGNDAFLYCGVSAGTSCLNPFATAPVSTGDRVSLRMFYYYPAGGSSSLMRTNYSIELHPLTPPE
jgi:hypothetical protein